MAILEKDLSPERIKKLDHNQLVELAQEMRDVIIRTVSRNGGHLASSLGVVEIAIALHRVFDAPRDKIIWDVGHQCYPHKVLTGRLDRFHTLRQFGGISGFPKAAESPFDCFDTGHSGTSISAALGMATQRDLKGKSHRVIAVIGDASLTNGMALEALNHAGFMGTDLLVVLNDNEKSISRNVGAYSRYLNRLRVELAHIQEKQRAKDLHHHGESAHRVSTSPLAQFQERLKHILTPSRTGAVFQELGFAYLGPIDGHDIRLLCQVFEAAKSLKGPVLVHAATKKGKGYPFAEKDSTKFHGVGVFNKSNGTVETRCRKTTYTSVFGETLVGFARKDKDIVAITAAMEDGTGLTQLKQEFPSRFFDVGIAEEHAVTFAAGLAKAGAKPFVAIYSTFLQRAYDQILHDVCLQNLPVRFMIDRAGLVGEDGPTHHGVFDLSYLRTMPNMVIMAPKDGNELRHMIKTAIEYDAGPIAVRYPRGDGLTSDLGGEPMALPIGSWEPLTDGHSAVVLAVGSMVYPALKAAELLRGQGLCVSVVNARFIKPLDKRFMEGLTQRFHHIITVEENVLAGGFGSAVVEYLSDQAFHSSIVKRIGLPDAFVDHGAADILKENNGLSPTKLAKTIQDFVNERAEVSAKKPGRLQLHRPSSLDRVLI
jgi:1-deoxy-D-xylulose-5-phosphate synthase